jgi:DNA-binding transcriptional MerR regulator
MEDLLSTRDAAILVGRSESAIRTWARRGQLEPVKQDGRANMYRRSDLLRVAAACDATPHGRPTTQSRKPGMLTLREFARRAGLNEKTITRYRSSGVIAAYTEAELEKFLARRDDGGEVQEVDVTSTPLDEMANASKAELERALAYEKLRKARLDADRAEGRVYDAEAVQAVVKRLAHHYRTSWQQAALLLAGRMAGRTEAECREILVRYASEQIAAAEKLGREIANASR